jgi:hypothetical protein
MKLFLPLTISILTMATAQSSLRGKDTQRRAQSSDNGSLVASRNNTIDGSSQGSTGNSSDLEAAGNEILGLIQSILITDKEVNGNSPGGDSNSPIVEGDNNTSTTTDILGETLSGIFDNMFTGGYNHSQSSGGMNTDFLDNYNATNTAEMWLDKGIQIMGDVLANVAEEYFASITCPAVDAEPTCKTMTASIWPDAPDGTWVCRTLKHPVTGEDMIQSACIDPEWALETDECGCCNGGCPTVCDSCPCDLYETGDQSGVLVETNMFNGLIVYNSCVAPELAITLIAQSNATKCLELCPDN